MDPGLGWTGLDNVTAGKELVEDDSVVGRSSKAEERQSRRNTQPATKRRKNSLFSVTRQIESIEFAKNVNLVPNQFIQHWKQTLNLKSNLKVHSDFFHLDPWIPVPWSPATGPL